MSGELENECHEGPNSICSVDEEGLTVDFETQARLEALLEAAGIGKLSTSDGKAFADPDVLHRLTSTVSYALDEAAAALSRLRAEAAGRNAQRSLPEACSDGDVATVRRLLDEGQSVHETTEDGESLLSLACSAGYFELTEVLLSMRANVEERGPKGGCTPLMEAASGGYKDIVELLIEHGADINALSNTGNTALTFACCGGYEDIVKILIAAGADLEVQNENGHTPLMEAASGGHVNIAAILLQSGAGINTHSNEFKESALTLACYKGHLEMVQFLLQAGADQEHKTDEMHTALMEASMDGHVDVAQLLLDSGAQVNMPADSFESPLTLAACGGHVALASLLLSRGANLEEVNDEGYTPLMEAAREGHEEMVSVLISHGANVNALTEETRETALTLSACGGFIECCKFLIQAGADLEAGCSTALMEAAQEGHLDLVKYLLEQGGNVDSQTSCGNTALSYACEHGRTDVINTLLATGACLEHESEGGRTPLMKASRAGHLCTVQYLLSQGANVNKATRNNEHTALSLACVYGHVSVVELLLLHGADSSYVLKDGSTMLLEAAKGGHTNVVQVLLDFPQYFSNPTFLPKWSVQSKSPVMEQSIPRVPTKALPLVVPPQEPDANSSICETAQGIREPSKGINSGVAMASAEPASYLCSDDCGEKTPQHAAGADTDIGDSLRAKSFLDKGIVADLLTSNILTKGAELELTKLEQRIKRVIETNAKLKFLDGKSKLTAESSLHAIQEQEDSRILKKQRILQELQKVELGLQEKAAQQLRNCLDSKIQNDLERLVERDAPDGGDSSADAMEIQAGPDFDGGNTAMIPQPFCDNPAVERFSPQGLNTSDEISCSDTATPPPSFAVENLATADGSPNTNIDINCSTESNNDTPLTLACAGGHLELVRLLITRGANLEHRDRKGFTPLILAATAGHVGVVTALLDANANIESQSERTKDTPLSLACSGGRLEVVEVLLERGANIEHRNVSDYTPLSLAASGGYVKIIELLLNSGAEINSRTGSKLGISPLMLAAMNGHKEAVLMLLDMGADINAQIETNRNTALTLACFQGRHEVVSLLVDRRANVEHRAKTGLTPLMEAASGGYAEVGRVLLEKGADPNAAPVPSSRDTALTIAADKGHLRFCELVLSRWAMVDVRNKKGNTPFWLACNGGYLDVAKLLAQHGASLDMTDNRSITPLMSAFRKGHLKVVRWLSKVVSHFPTDSECMRYVSTVSDGDLLKRCHLCMECMTAAKERQAQEANKYASELLEEIDKEKSREENKKERAARKREKRRKKRHEKQQSSKQGHQSTKANEPCAKRDSYSGIKDKVIQKETETAVVGAPKPLSENKEEAIVRLKPSLYTTPTTTRQSAAQQTPGKKSMRKDDEWKEVVRKCKKINVPSNLVSRIIGRGGCNINAIREETGAHIDINKQRKGPERTITIRGPTEAIRHAHSLITELMKDRNSDLEIQTIIQSLKLTCISAPSGKTNPTMQRPPSPSLIPLTAASVQIPASIISSSQKASKPKEGTCAQKLSSIVSESPAMSSNSTMAITTFVKQTVETSSCTSFATLSSSCSPSSITNNAPLSFKNSGKVINRPVQPVAPMISSKLSPFKSVHSPPAVTPPFHTSSVSMTPVDSQWSQRVPTMIEQQRMLTQMASVNLMNANPAPNFFSSDAASNYLPDLASPAYCQSNNKTYWEMGVQRESVMESGVLKTVQSRSIGQERKIWPIGTERRRGVVSNDGVIERPIDHFDVKSTWISSLHSSPVWQAGQVTNSSLEHRMSALPVGQVPPNSASNLFMNCNVMNRVNENVQPSLAALGGPLPDPNNPKHDHNGFVLINSTAGSDIQRPAPIGSHLLSGGNNMLRRSVVFPQSPSKPEVMKSVDGAHCGGGRTGFAQVDTPAVGATNPPPSWHGKQDSGDDMLGDNFSTSHPFSAQRVLGPSTSNQLLAHHDGSQLFSPFHLETHFNPAMSAVETRNEDSALNGGASGTIHYGAPEENVMWKW